MTECILEPRFEHICIFPVHEIPCIFNFFYLYFWLREHLSTSIGKNMLQEESYYTFRDFLATPVFAP